MKENQIIFKVPNEQGEMEAVITLAKGKFYYKEQEVDDVHQVYERFHEVLSQMERTVVKETSIEGEQAHIDNCTTEMPEVAKTEE